MRAVGQFSEQSATEQKPEAYQIVAIEDIHGRSLAFILPLCAPVRTAAEAILEQHGLTMNVTVPPFLSGSYGGLSEDDAETICKEICATEMHVHGIKQYVHNRIKCIKMPFRYILDPSFKNKDGCN